MAIRTLQPVFPEDCRVEGDDPGTLEGTGVVSSWRVQCDGSLLGRTVSVSGLAENKACDLADLELAELQQVEPRITADVYDVLSVDRAVEIAQAQQRGTDLVPQLAVRRSILQELGISRRRHFHAVGSSGLGRGLGEGISNFKKSMRTEKSKAEKEQESNSGS